MSSDIIIIENFEKFGKFDFKKEYKTKNFKTHTHIRKFILPNFLKKTNYTQTYYIQLLGVLFLFLFYENDDLLPAVLNHQYK